MEPPQPPNIETPSKCIMEAVNHNVHAPFQPFDETKQGRHNKKKFSTALVAGLAIFAPLDRLTDGFGRSDGLRWVQDGLDEPVVPFPTTI
jgi:hypothetical protein